jgi:hypothetical protein
MANDLTGNPWKVDTASATAIWSGNVWIKRLVWHEPTTSGHTLSITDAAGRVVWAKTALAGGSGLDYELDLETIVGGLIIPTITSGTLYIYLDQTP